MARGRHRRSRVLARGRRGRAAVPLGRGEVGGPGGDFLHSAIVIRGAVRGSTSRASRSRSTPTSCVPYIHSFGDDTQRGRWLPGCVSGEFITAIAMTEPDTGSDLAAIKTTAMRDGDEYVLNGSKTFISNGMLCDLCIVAAKTENSDDPHRAISLFVVEGDAPGFIRAKKLAKMGMASQDTAELAFEDCRIPAANRLGPERARVHDADAKAAARAARRRADRARQRRAGPRRHHRLRQGARRRSAGRSASSRTPSSSWPSARPRSRSAGTSSTP